MLADTSPITTLFVILITISCGAQNIGNLFSLSRRTLQSSSKPSVRYIIGQFKHWKLCLIIFISSFPHLPLMLPQKLLNSLREYLLEKSFNFFPPYEKFCGKAIYGVPPITVGLQELFPLLPSENILLLKEPSNFPLTNSSSE